VPQNSCSRVSVNPSLRRRPTKSRHMCSRKPGRTSAKRATKSLPPISTACETDAAAFVRRLLGAASANRSGHHADLVRGPTHRTWTTTGQRAGRHGAPTQSLLCVAVLARDGTCRCPQPGFPKPAPRRRNRPICATARETRRPTRVCASIWSELTSKMESGYSRQARR
jgi:hypothetical protein